MPSLEEFLEHIKLENKEAAAPFLFAQLISSPLYALHR